jgi:hypothetical protein
MREVKWHIHPSPIPSLYNFHITKCLLILFPLLPVLNHAKFIITSTFHTLLYFFYFTFFWLITSPCVESFPFWNIKNKAFLYAPLLVVGLCVFFVSSYMSSITAYVFASRPLSSSLFLSFFPLFCVCLCILLSTPSIYSVTGHIKLSSAYHISCSSTVSFFCNHTVTQAPASASIIQKTKTSLGNNVHIVTSKQKKGGEILFCLLLLLRYWCLTKTTNQTGVCHKQTENAVLSFKAVK